MTEVTRTIRLSASLRQLAGAKVAVVKVPPGSTVTDLLHALRLAYPALAEHILDTNDHLTAGMQFLIDGRHIDFLQGDDSPIDQAQDLMLVPPISGG